MKKIIFLDPKCEVLKLIDVNTLSDFIVDFDGQLLSLEALELFDIIACINTVNKYNRRILSRFYLENKRNVVVFQDGVYEWANAYKNPKHLKSGIKLYEPLLGDAFLYVGGYELNNIFKENPHVNFYQYKPKRMTLKHELINSVDSKEKFLLITTANTAYFSDKEFTVLLNLLKLTIDNALDVYDKVYLRLFDKRLCDSLAHYKLENITECSFSESIKNMQAIITTPSTIVLEAMAANKPVAVLDYRDNPLLVTSGWKITGFYSIKDTLLSMKKNDAERMEIQNRIINRANDYSNVNELLVKISNTPLDDINVLSRKKVEVEYIKSLEGILNSKFNFNFYILTKKLINCFFRLKEKLHKNK